MSYYGGTVMTMLGRAAPSTRTAPRRSRRRCSRDDWYDLRPADSFTDVHKDWADPAHLEHEPEMLPGTGWQWYGIEQVVEGRLWGGCLEIVDFNLRVGTHLPDDAAYDGCVLHLETSEELPTAQYVGEVLMCMGERGLLQRFSASADGPTEGLVVRVPEQPRAADRRTSTPSSRPSWARSPSTTPASRSSSTSTSATPTRSWSSRTAVTSGSTQRPGRCRSATDAAQLAVNATSESRRYETAGHATLSVMDLNLTDKTAIVTGGSRGIGLAIAAGLAAEGARVVVGARTRLCGAGLSA